MYTYILYGGGLFKILITNNEELTIIYIMYTATVFVFGADTLS